MSWLSASIPVFVLAATGCGASSSVIAGDFLIVDASTKQPLQGVAVDCPRSEPQQTGPDGRATLRFRDGGEFNPFNIASYTTPAHRLASFVKDGYEQQLLDIERQEQDPDMKKSIRRGRLQRTIFLAPLPSTRPAEQMQ